MPRQCTRGISWARSGGRPSYPRNWRSKMTELNVLQSLFAVFYAIFWGVVANAQPRWRAFNWPVAFKFTRTRRRLAVAIWLLNLAPVLVFVVFLVMFRGVTLEWAPSGVPWLAGLQIFLAIVAAQV